MKPSLDSRAYTNFILTAIAILLLATVVKDFNLGVASTAQAQTMYKSSAANPDPITSDENIAKVQDTAVADATREVASANREIADAVRELAAQMKSVAEAIRSAAGAAGAKAGTAASAVEVTP